MRQILPHNEVFDNENNFIKYRIKSTIYNPLDIMQQKIILVDFYYGISIRSDNQQLYDVTYIREEYQFTIIQTNNDILEYLSNIWENKYKPHIQIQVELQGLEGVVIRSQEFQMVEEFKNTLIATNMLLELLSSAVDEMILGVF